MYSQYGMNQTKSTVGGLAVGVPGEMRGEYRYLPLKHTEDQAGKLSMTDMDSYPGHNYSHQPSTLPGTVSP